MKTNDESIILCNITYHIENNHVNLVAFYTKIYYFIIEYVLIYLKK